MNGDGVLSQADFELALELAVGQRPATASEIAAGDLNGNGVRQGSSSRARRTCAVVSQVVRYLQREIRGAWPQSNLGSSREFDFEIIGVMEAVPAFVPTIAFESKTQVQDSGLSAHLAHSNAPTMHLETVHTQLEFVVRDSLFHRLK